MAVGTVGSSDAGGPLWLEVWGGRGGPLAATLRRNDSSGDLVHWVLCFGEWTHIRCFSSTLEHRGVAVTVSPHALAVLTSDVAGGVLLRLSCCLVTWFRMHD